MKIITRRAAVNAFKIGAISPCMLFYSFSINGKVSAAAFRLRVN